MIVKQESEEFTDSYTLCNNADSLNKILDSPCILTTIHFPNKTSKFYILYAN